MDKKKLIGTIIGVTLFAALIAGATFAWLTFAAGVNNGVYNSKTRNFFINYVGGSQIESIPTLVTATGGASATATPLTVSAYRAANSANGILYLKMTTEDTTAQSILDSGALNYAVCSGSATTANCTALTEGSTGVLKAGTITEYDETELYNTGTSGIPTTQTYYWIYFWLDAANVNTDMVGDNISYSGYIHASAEQTELSYE